MPRANTIRNDVGKIFSPYFFLPIFFPPSILSPKPNPFFHSTPQHLSVPRYVLTGARVKGEGDIGDALRLILRH